MDASELKGTTHFLRDFGDIHHGISCHLSLVHHLKSKIVIRNDDSHSLTHVRCQKKYEGLKIAIGNKSTDFPGSIFLYLMKSKLSLLDSDDPINSLP